MGINSLRCVLTQERTYRSPEKRSSLPRPAKSLTRHIPAAEQEDNSTPSRPTCKNTFQIPACLPLYWFLYHPEFTCLLLFFYFVDVLPHTTVPTLPGYFLQPVSLHLLVFSSFSKRSSRERTPGPEEPLVWQVDHPVAPVRPSSSTYTT